MCLSCRRCLVTNSANELFIPDSKLETELNWVDLEPRPPQMNALRPSNLTRLSTPTLSLLLCSNMKDRANLLCWRRWASSILAEILINVSMHQNLICRSGSICCITRFQIILSVYLERILAWRVKKKLIYYCIRTRWN